MGRITKPWKKDEFHKGEGGILGQDWDQRVYLHLDSRFHLQLPTSISPSPPAPLPAATAAPLPGTWWDSTCLRFCASSPPCCRPHPQLQQRPRNIARPMTPVTGAASSCSTHRFGHNVPQPVHVFLDNLCVQLPPALIPTISWMKTK